MEPKPFVCLTLVLDLSLSLSSLCCLFDWSSSIRYTFKSIDLLCRATTHASFSEENNKAFAILTASVIETFVSFHLLSKDVDVSSKELNRQLSQVTNEDFSLIFWFMWQTKWLCFWFSFRCNSDFLLLNHWLWLYSLVPWCFRVW